MSAGCNADTPAPVPKDGRARIFCPTGHLPVPARSAEASLPIGGAFDELPDHGARPGHRLLGLVRPVRGGLRRLR